MRELSYLTDQYQDKIEAVNRFAAPLNFVFITDPHHRRHEFSVKEGRVEGMTEYEYAVNAPYSISLTDVLESVWL